MSWESNIFRRIEQLSLGYKSKEYGFEADGGTRPIANYTPPGSPTFVDVFKGDDGVNFVQKTYLMTKASALAALCMASGDMCVYSNPKNLGDGLKRVALWTVPLIGGGIAYTSAVCIAASLRKKNDEVNHFWGGVGAGIVFGGARRSILFGILTGGVAVLAGMWYKESVVAGYELFPDINRRAIKRGMPNSHKWDYSLFPEMKGNWYTDPTPMPPPLPGKSATTGAKDC